MAIEALVVEDDAASLVLLEYLVESLSFTAILATDLASARRGLINRKPHLALLDLELPDGDGVDLISDVRLRVPNAAIGVLSGRVARFQESVNWEGVDIAFPKPIDPDEVGGWLEAQAKRWGVQKSALGI